MRVRDLARRPRRQGCTLLLTLTALPGIPLLGGGTQPASQQPAPAVQRPFADSSFWNAPLPADAPIDPSSSAYVSALRNQVAAYGTWINTDRYSVPVYTAPAGAPTVRVVLDSFDPQLQQAFEQVPIPAGAQPAAGNDAQMVVWQPATDTMWEFWRAYKLLGTWHAGWGGRMTNVSASAGYYSDPANWGATGTSLPLLGGLMRIAELQSGTIDHALAIAVPETTADVYSWPAQRSDGTSHSSLALPEGIRFRIDPAFDLSTVQMSPLARTMAVAAQRYGIVIRDTGGSVAFYAEDPTPTGSDPYDGPGGIFGGVSPAQALAQFPWDHLEALQTQLSTGGSTSGSTAQGLDGALPLLLGGRSEIRRCSALRGRGVRATRRHRAGGRARLRAGRRARAGRAGRCARARRAPARLR